jgi:hypothetical protein
VIIKCKDSYQRYIDKNKWRQWFAWHPVRINGKELVWLEKVERKLEVIYLCEEWKYRRIERN